MQKIISFECNHKKFGGLLNNNPKFFYFKKRGIFFLIVFCLTLIIGTSYGYFVIITGDYKASDLLISELQYGLTIEEDGSSISTINGNNVIVPAGKKAYFYVTLSSINKIDSKYTLAYNKTNGAVVQYTDRTPWSSQGVIKGYDESIYTKKIRVVIDNSEENTSGAVTFAVYGGYTFNDFAMISLENGYYSVNGPYNEIVAVRGSRLVNLIEGETKCTTESGSSCLYEGGSINNYLQYPEDADKSKNIWRVIGTYRIDDKTVTKLVSESTVTTTAENISTSLNSFYKTLTNTERIIYKTNKFNCSSSGCVSSTYNNIGLISTYEYESIGGIDSYLGNKNSYFGINGERVSNITSSGIEETTSETNSELRPSVYLQTDIKITESGTINDPYTIVNESDINLVAWKLDNQDTDMSYETLMSEKYVDRVECINGTDAEWDYSNNRLILENIKVPEYCTIYFVSKPTFYVMILTDYTTVLTRSSYSAVVGTSTATTKTIYKTNGTNTEDGSDVYYFAGNVADNWVKFAGAYWRIIRTNEDGSVRLLYAGTTPDTTEGYITGSQPYNETYNNTMYVGYMYGTTGSIANNRKNTTSSPIKTVVDNWYRDNIYSEYENYISQTAIYCNDRSGGGYASSGTMHYAAYNRLNTNKSPSFKCGNNPSGTLYGDANVADKFSKSTTNGGNGQLTYPVGLMTADELAFAGGVFNTNSPYAYYYLNSIGGSVTGDKWWWTMSPHSANGANQAYVFNVYGSTYPGYLGNYGVSPALAVRPVVSLKSCVLVSGGNGTSGNPYTVELPSTCASVEN